MLVNFLNKIMVLYSNRENNSQNAQCIPVYVGGGDDTDYENRVSKYIPQQKTVNLCRDNNKPFKKNIDDITIYEKDIKNRNNKRITPSDVVIFSGVAIIMCKLIRYYRN
jgi:hypothetical protein